MQYLALFGLQPALLGIVSSKGLLKKVLNLQKMTTFNYGKIWAFISLHKRCYNPGPL